MLAYLSKHPQASDTVAGICVWWLPSEGIDEIEGLVEEELAAMVEQDVIRRIALGGGAQLYGARGRDDDAGGVA